AQLVQEIIRHTSNPVELQRQVEELAPRLERPLRITLIDESGKVLADTDEAPERMENHGTRPEVLAAKQAQFGSDTRLSQTVLRPYMYVALRSDTPGPVAFVRVALELTRVERQLASVRWLVLTTAGFTTGAALLLTWWLTRRLVQPLQEITEAAQRIGASGY